MRKENQLLTVETLYKILKTLVENGDGSREVKVSATNGMAESVNEVRLVENNSLWLDARKGVL